MDIPVSRLNQRMALQLPAELPLGLVFVVGQVQLQEQTTEAEHSGAPVHLFLADNEYRLPCRLSERAAAEFRLEEGEMVRAGGHLVFEPAWASYYLLARDIEHLDRDRPAAKPLAAIIADNNRREQAASLAPAELPGWVQQMAPPEVRSQQANDRLAAAIAVTAPQLSGDWELLADPGAAVAYPEAEPALADMSDDLIAFLSQAMDSDVEVEITPEIVSDLNATGKTDRLSPEVLDALDLFEASVGRKPPEVEAEERLPVAATTLSDEELDEALAGVAAALAAVNQEPPAAEASVVSEPEAVTETGAQQEVAAVIAQEPPKPPAAAADDSPTASKKAKSGDVIPWYVALLIIVVVMIILAALVYVLLVPDSLPFNLSLSLPEDFPQIN